MSGDKIYLSKDEQDESLRKKNALTDWRSFTLLMHYVRPYTVPLAAALALVFFSALCTLFSAKFTGGLVQEGLLEKNLSLAKKFAFYVVGLEILALLMIYAGRRVIAHYAFKTIYDIRQSLFDHLQKLPMSFYDRQPQGRIITRITHDIDGIESFFTSSLSRLVNALMMATMAMFAMVWTEWKLGSLLVLFVLPGLFFLFGTRNIVRQVMRKMSQASSAINAKLAEFLSGIEVIRTYGLEEWSGLEFQKTIDKHHQAQIQANTFFAWTRPLTATLCVLPLVSLLYFGGHRVMAGTMSVGLFVTFLRYCESFFSPIRTLSQELHIIQQAFTSIERVSNFLSHEVEDVVFGADKRPVDGSFQLGNISFKNVFMTYAQGVKNPSSVAQTAWVLKDLSFSIRAGEKIGLVGRTGCGKTSTVSLLARLYAYQKGQIFLSDRPIEDFSRSYLRQNIGFVSQDVILFKGTLAENLCLGESYSIRQLEEACVLTGLANVMAGSGLAFTSIILEDGSNLSVGERQLVSLTRVLLANPQVLILDEATANIDPVMEKIIHHAVDRVMRGRTCLMIAHRLDTLKNCQRLLVFADGRLVEEGTYATLMGNRGGFYEMHAAAHTVSAVAPSI